jgi:hypothetical protein
VGRKKAIKRANKATQNRTVSSATPRQTAGPGFTFEDLTAAWLLTKILSGEALPGVGTSATRIQSQTSALKWHVDDLLVSSGDDGGGASHLAISCKSSLQVSSNRLPPDFVHRVWAQWRDASGPFQRGKDVLALVTRGSHNTFPPLWSDIVLWCSGADPALAIQRIRSSKSHSRIFDSIIAPNGANSGTDEEAVELIRHVNVTSLDFQLASSEKWQEAIGKCRSILASGGRSAAEALWTHLLHLTSEMRVGSSTLLISDVWSSLRRQFDLRDHPHFDSCWGVIRALTSEYIDHIQTILPAGNSIDRGDYKDRLTAMIAEQTVSIVFGDSGTGKSALLKGSLDERFPDWQQVWLGPEQVDTLISDLHRRSLGLRHPLRDVLKATTRAKNVLVLDSAERLSSDSLAPIRKVIDELVPNDTAATDSPWRVVIVSQSAGWRDRLQGAIGRSIPRLFPVEAVNPDEVRKVVRSIPGLRWLATQGQTVGALTNLRTLAWVVEAADSFRGGPAQFSSPPAIADRVWQFWTDGRPDAHSLLVRMGMRDAEFVRSVALSELDPADTQTLHRKPPHLPLRKNTRNHIEFEHDLAADWARFQRLKEIAHDVEEWSLLANNALWSGALRLLGQFLLRESSGTSTAWDLAVAQVESIGATLAADVLLDAICLDPQAEQFLDERAQFLFANHGSRLNRLLRRFLHIASVPSAPDALRNSDPAIARLIDEKYRMPIIGLWGPIANFLSKHIDTVAELASPTVAATCETWLTSTPVEISPGVPTLFRNEFARVALATARALQVEVGTGTMHGRDIKKPIYSAALAAADEFPDDTSTWALEMARRRKRAQSVTMKIEAVRRRAALEQTPETDPGSASQQQRLAQKMAAVAPVIPLARKLPPWPLGPRGRVDQEFQDVCVHSPALHRLMRSRPDVASEILLAVLIEGAPREEYSSSLRDEHIGLEYAHADSYPTIYWKSPFLAFLQIAPDTALNALIQLVNFCTDRWAQERHKRGDSVPELVLTDRDGREYRFVGNARVLDWAQDNSNFIGQLHCSLNALEKWLTLRVDERADISGICERLLRECSSVAIVGVLLDVAKYSPTLLAGELMLLLSNAALFRTDETRVSNFGVHFDGFSWARYGEAVFNAAREWALAPYKKRTLTELAVEQLSRNAELAGFLKKAVHHWARPDDDDTKAALEFDILCAQLDADNYRGDRNDGNEILSITFVPPEALRLRAEEYQRAAALKLRSVVLPYQCEEILRDPAAQPSDAACDALAAVLESQTSSFESEADELRNKIAAGATLIAKRADWLEARSELDDAAKAMVRSLLDALEVSSDELRRRRIGPGDPTLDFATYAVFYLWLRSGGEWEKRLLMLLTTGDDQVASTIGKLGFLHRNELGVRWWRLQQVGILWSALSMLAPGYGDPNTVNLCWDRWVSRFREWKLSGVTTDRSAVDLVDVWERLVRLRRDRFRRSLPKESHSATHVKEAPNPPLDTAILDSFFRWLLDEKFRPEAEAYADCQSVILCLWAYERRYCAKHREADGEFRVPGRFAYDILAKLPFYTVHAPQEAAVEIWRSVLDLGPGAHHLIEYFCTSWFMQLRHSSDLDAFYSRWRAMIEFALSAEWSGPKSYRSRRILRQILGFESESFLRDRPESTQRISQMRDLYYRWAESHLSRDEDDVAGLSYFLASKAGEALRIDGLKWLSAALNRNPSVGRWWRREAAGDALISVLSIALTTDAARLTRDAEARAAVVSLTAYAAAQQVPGALPLQERVKQLSR